MYKSRSLLLSASPFGYISNNQKKILSDFCYLEEALPTQKYWYSYLNGSYYHNLLLLICFATVEKNLISLNKINAQNIAVGTRIKVEKTVYIFSGYDSELDLFILKPEKKTKQSLSVYRVPKDIIENKAVILKNSGVHKRTNFRNKFAMLLGIQENENAVNYRSIIIVQKTILNILENTTIKYDNKEYYLGELCSASYLSKGLNKSSIKGSDASENSMIIFSSSINSVIEFIENDLNMIDNLKIFVLGEKWTSGIEMLNLVSLEDLCEEYGIPLRIFSTTAKSISKESLELMEKFDTIKCWLPDSMTNNDESEIRFHFIKSNKDFKNSIEELEKVMVLIKDDIQLRYLNKLLIIFIKLIFSQVTGNLSYLDSFAKNILDYSKQFSDIDNSLLEKNLYNLIDNRFGFQVKRILNSVIEDNKKTALIIAKEFYEPTAKHFKFDSSVDVFSSDSKITEDLYGVYKKLIILVPFAKERSNWIYSSISNNIDILIPDVQKKFLKYALKKEKRLLSKLKQQITLGSDLGNFAYYKEIDELLLVNDDINEELVQISVDNNEDESERLDYQEYLNIIEKFERESENNKTQDNGLVTVLTVVNFFSATHMFGTEYGTTFVLDINNYIKKIEISKLSVGDKVVNLVVPYSDEFYRRTFNVKPKSQTVETNRNIIEDEYWKRKFMNYVLAHSIKPSELKYFMERNGFSRKTLSFYNNWTNLEKLPIVPQDKEFIKYIGILMGDALLEHDYERFYISSYKVRENLSQSRISILETFHDSTLKEICESGFVDNHTVEEVASIERFEIEEVPRYLTNKVLR